MTILGYTILFFTIGPLSILAFLLAYLLYRAVLADHRIPPSASFMDFFRDLFDVRFDDYRESKKNGVEFV